MVLTLNFKVVGNQVNGTTGHKGVGGLSRGSPESARVSPRRVAASSVWLDRIRVLSRVAALGAHIWFLHLVLALTVEGLLVLHMLGVRKLLILHILLADATHVLRVLGLWPWILWRIRVWLVVAVRLVLVLIWLHGKW